VLAATFGDTLFDVLKSTHVLLAAVWVGGNFTLNVAANLAFVSRDPARQSVILRTTELIGTRVFTPVGLIVLAVGVWMVSRYDTVYDLGDYWVAYGLGFFVVTFVLGAGFLGPRSKKLAEQIDAGADQEVVQRTARPFRLIAAIDLTLLMSVVVMMVVKPI
jgi:uncharacterized membrane protein